MTVQHIKENCLIPIQIHTDFYTRIKQLALYLANSVNSEELNNQIDAIKNDSELSEFGYCYETVLILLKEIEQQALNNDLIEDREIN